MYEDKIVLCGANSYEEKFYMNPDFDNLRIISKMN